MNRPPQASQMLCFAVTGAFLYAMYMIKPSSALLRVYILDTQCVLCIQEADCRARDRNLLCSDPKCHYHVHKRFCGGGYIKVHRLESYA